MNIAPKKIFIAVFISAVCGYIFFTQTYQKPLELYPENQTFFEFENTARHLHCNIRRNYGQDCDDPPAILMFHAHELARNLDLTGFRYICINIDSKKTLDFTISLYMYIRGFSDIADTETHRPYSIRVRVRENQVHYHYKLQDFATPVRWFAQHSESDLTLPKTDWSLFTHLTISNFENSPENTEPQIVLKRLRFVDDFNEKLRNSVIFGILIFAVILIFFNIRKKQTKKTNKRGATVAEDADKLLEYIDNNLSNPLLSLDLIEKETALNKFAVNEILKTRKNTQYKNYIHDLRISEAKRLLTETDHPISLIAENCGYCYSNSFSRVFVKHCQMTPNEYRKKYSK